MTTDNRHRQESVSDRKQESHCMLLCTLTLSVLAWFVILDLCTVSTKLVLNSQPFTLFSKNVLIIQSYTNNLKVIHVLLSRTLDCSSLNLLLETMIKKRGETLMQLIFLCSLKKTINSICNYNKERFSKCKAMITKVS